MGSDSRAAEQRVKWVYGAASAGQSRDRYDEWAPHYERDLLDTYGYRLPDAIAAHFTRWVTAPAHVLDAGVGTGLVGARLADRGFTDLVGLDNSSAMLQESARKGLYGELHHMTLGEPLGFESNSFDAVVSAGTFTEGHAPASGLRELVRVTRPGGHVVVGIRPDIIDSHGFRAVIDELVAGGAWELLERTEPYVAMEKVESHVLVETWCFRIL
ncbi:MAG: class I SAM-dependent methyltransferase [bacterium]|nr:class I SAM-dependent methyltransferase [bacterium]MDE0289122.1 class I SAM-dependent methyltransferase [bacterium]MDE0440377.1 class I SAM-dependent methyltransferase [bacterium]